MLIQLDAVNEKSNEIEQNDSIVRKDDRQLNLAKPPGPDDLSATPSDGPRQPILKEYPYTVIGEKRRAFNSSWYKQYPWLEYSLTSDAAFCFACRHFAVSGETRFTVDGWTNWKKASYSDSGFSLHNTCDSHLNSMIFWCEYNNIKNSGAGNVMQLQNDAYAMQVIENRHYVKTIAEVLLLTATQNLAQRGHRELLNDIGKNPGNFKKLLTLVVRHDPALSARFLDGETVTRYTCPTIQNEILATLADMVRRGIINDVKTSKYFTILLDESKDVSKKEQVSFVLRFFDNKCVRECFVDFKPASSLDAESLSSLVLKTLSSYGLDVKAHLVGQGYDGAAVMSGIHKGVQKRVRDSAPYAVYVHCYAHRLNLVLVDACKSVTAAADFFALLEHLYVFTSGSLMHLKWVEAQQDLYPNDAPRQLQRLSDTRWSCRAVACKNIRDRLDALVSFLEDISEDSDSERAVEAKGLLAQLDFKFVLMLNVFCDLLGKIHGVSMQLQSATLDTGKAVLLVESLVDSLKEFRISDSALDQFFTLAEMQCNKSGIEAKFHTATRRVNRVRRMPPTLNSSVVLQSVGQRDAVDSKESFKQHVFYVILDSMIGELENRFSSNASSVMLGIQCLNPIDESFLDLTKMGEFIQFYGGNAEDITHEAYQLKKLLSRTKNDHPVATMLELAIFLKPYSIAFHELYRLLIIALVLPVSTASCERSFSAMKLIKKTIFVAQCVMTD